MIYVAERRRTGGGFMPPCPLMLMAKCQTMPYRVLSEPALVKTDKLYAFYSNFKWMFWLIQGDRRGLGELWSALCPPATKVDSKDLTLHRVLSISILIYCYLFYFVNDFCCCFCFTHFFFIFVYNFYFYWKCKLMTVWHTLSISTN